MEAMIKEIVRVLLSDIADKKEVGTDQHASESEGIGGSLMVHPARNHGLHGHYSWHAAWVKLVLYSSPPRAAIPCYRYYRKILHPPPYGNKRGRFACTGFVKGLSYATFGYSGRVLYPFYTWRSCLCCTRRKQDDDTCHLRVILRQHS
ncbi:hypothetical protein VNO78_15961 [Psophocarpus tetragonolobus]|uniref:Uncharacterized protein n=1 Tax=Psophocarpus tetragonolobus TaxID=3891 RepID=A0AAN9SGZ7_PSOTE